MQSTINDNQKRFAFLTQDKIPEFSEFWGFTC